MHAAFTRCIRRAPLVAALCFAVLVPAVEAGNEAVHVLMTADGTVIELPWSDAWTDAPEHKTSPQAVAFHSRKPGACVVVISVMPPIGSSIPDDAVRLLMKEYVESVRERAVEKSLVPRKTGDEAPRGLFVDVTNSAPKADESRFARFVVILVGDRPLTAYILFNEHGREESERAFDALMHVQLLTPDRVDANAAPAVHQG